METKITSFAELPKIIKAYDTTEEAPKRKERTKAWTEPVYVRKLADIMPSYKEVGVALGLTGTTISEALRLNKVSLVIELAAKGVYEEKQVKLEACKPEMYVVAMTMSDAQLNVLKPWLQQCEITFSATSIRL